VSKKYLNSASVPAPPEIIGSGIFDEGIIEFEEMTSR
jgi:hypothetical protein